ncbi:MFS transporter [Natranaerofaba carboxydovora]|uniref:MFS transporter n=1 Tax=Natranaerofaba carboxydovora TaxID=2742683 RepID=UPI001F14310E|nr:MFS transporter [Natranaerofaba carboxydovora]UMZ74620.1 putative sulfoacetate transporter SauU [Natranaerofaba carboxydovora]
MRFVDKRESYRWLIWFVMALAFLVGFFHRYSVAVVSEDLSGELSLTGAMLSNLVSMYFYAYAAMQIPVGIFADSIGPRKVATFGILFAGIGSALFGIVDSYFLASLSRLLVGLGVSTVLVSLFKIQSVWFKQEEFATVTGLTSLVGNVGGLLATTPFALLVIGIGWRSSFILIGIFSLVLAIFMWKIIRDNPADMGFKPVVSDETESENENNDNQRKISVFTGIKRVFLNPYTWPNFIIIFGILGIIMSYSGNWGVPYLSHSYGMDRDVAANQVLFFTLGVIVGSPIMGRLADYLGKRKLLIQIGALIFTVSWGVILFLAGGKPPALLIPFLNFLMGFWGVFAMLCFTNVKEVNDVNFSGISTSVINVAPFLGTSLMNNLIGWRLDSLWTGELLNGVRVYELFAYVDSFRVYLFFSVLALIASFFIKEKKR